MALTTTWDEIRITTLQKMFLISGSELVDDATTKPYISSMPAVYNEAVRLLSTVNRYVTKYFEVDSDGTRDRLAVYLDEVVDDLFRLKEHDIYFTDASGIVSECRDIDNYGNAILLLDGSEVGTYRVYYHAYPLKVTIQTEGKTDLQIDPDVASIIPLYMASQLYKDDDNAIATVYRNEFEVARDLLEQERFSNGTFGEWKNTTGWR